MFENIFSSKYTLQTTRMYLCVLFYTFFKLSYSLDMVMNEDALLLADRLPSILNDQVVNSETSFIQLQALCISRVRFSVQSLFSFFFNERLLSV